MWKALFSMGYEKDGFVFLTDRFVCSETVSVNYFADAKCEIIAEVLGIFSAITESEMKYISSRPQAYFTCKADLTNPARDLFR